MTLDDLWRHTLMKNLRLHNVDILEKFFFKRLGVKQIIYRRKRWFWLLDYLISIWPIINELWGHTLFNESASS